LRGHGKTCYLAALLLELDLRQQTPDWAGFSYVPIDPESIKELRSKRDSLYNGKLPERTVAQSLIPIMLRLHGIPAAMGRCQLLLYDTSGESFDKAELIEGMHYGSIGRISNVIWLVDLQEVENLRTNLTDTIAVYIQTMAAMGLSTARQNLLVVLTKGDRLLTRNDLPGSVREFLTNRTETFNGSAMEKLSKTICEWLHNLQSTSNFVRLARQEFRCASYAVVSSLGSEPQGNRLPRAASPRGVEYPFLWACGLAGHLHGARRFRAFRRTAARVLPGLVIGGLYGVVVGGLLWAVLLTLTNLANAVLPQISSMLDEWRDAGAAKILKDLYQAFRKAIPHVMGGILSGAVLFGLSEACRSFYPRHFLSPVALLRRASFWMILSAITGVLVLLGLQFIDPTTTTVYSDGLVKGAITWFERGGKIGTIFGIIYAVLVPLIFLRSAGQVYIQRPHAVLFSLFSGAAIALLLEVSRPWWFIWFGVTLVVSAVFAIYDINVSRQSE
jgi:hypothetical protein